MSQFFGMLAFLGSAIFGLPLDLFIHIQEVALQLPNSRACETEGEHPTDFY
jgi:hypothetical protein